MSELFHTIRSRSEQIAEHARWVKIDQSRLSTYPESLLLSPQKMQHTPEHHLLNRGDETLSYFLILNTINFGSGYFCHLEDAGQPWSYFATARRLKEYCEASEIPTAASLRQYKAEDCARIFQVDLSNPHAAELMELFSLSLRELGSWVIDRHNGHYLNFLRKAKSVEGAVAKHLEILLHIFLSKYRFSNERKLHCMT
jgi:hypothetical protein